MVQDGLPHKGRLLHQGLHWRVVFTRTTCQRHHCTSLDHQTQ